MGDFICLPFLLVDLEDVLRLVRFGDTLFTLFSDLFFPRSLSFELTEEEGRDTSSISTSRILNEFAISISGLNGTDDGLEGLGLLVLLDSDFFCICV